MPGTTETGRAHRQQILEFIAGYHQQYGMAPNLREVAAGIGLGFSTTVHHVQVLVFEGRLSQRPRVARSLRVVDGPTGLGATASRSNDQAGSVGAVEMHSREPG